MNKSRDPFDALDDEPFENPFAEFDVTEPEPVIEQAEAIVETVEVEEEAEPELPTPPQGQLDKIDLSGYGMPEHILCVHDVGRSLYVLTNTTNGVSVEVGGTIEDLQVACKYYARVLNRA